MLLQTKRFDWAASDRHKEKEMNNWLDENRDVRIHDIKYSTCVDENEIWESALVIYEITEDEEEDSE